MNIFREVYMLRLIFGTIYCVTAPLAWTSKRVAFRKRKFRHPKR